MDLFTIKNNSIHFSPEALLIPEFKALWNRDKFTGRMKVAATEELAYVYFMTDYQSPYMVYPEDERATVVKKEQVLSRPRWKPDAAVKLAIEKYERLQQTPSLRLLKAVQGTLDKMTVSFENINFDPKAVDGDGKKLPVADMNKTLDSTGKISKALSAISELQKKVKSEQNVEATIRGGGIVGDYEQ